MNAIVSVTSNWGIGNKGQLLVRNKADMKRFVGLTMGGTVLMGRKTLESFPKGPLKGRRNVVVSAQPGYAVEGAEVFSTPEAALAAVAGDENVWLIGGESIYRALLDKCEKAYVTKNDVVVEADAFFPDLDADDSGWIVCGSEGAGKTEDGVNYLFVTYAKLP